MCTSVEAASLTRKHRSLKTMFRFKVVHSPVHGRHAGLPFRCNTCNQRLSVSSPPSALRTTHEQILALQVYSAAVYLFGHISGAHYTLDIDEIKHSVVSLSTAGILLVHCGPLTAPVSLVSHSACGPHRVCSSLVCTPV